MIIVTGATGNYGRLVVDGLLKEIPAQQVGVSTRDPEKAQDLQERGVRVCKGDFAEPATLRDAFDGAEQVLIVSGTALGAEGVRQHGNAIQAAKEAGAKRILYTSHQGRGEASIFVPTRNNHVPTDALLAACGVPYVSLQNGFYAESALFQLRGWNETGRLALPADGRVSWTSRADLAEAAVALLLDPTLLPDGASPALTASETLDFSDVAQILSALSGKSVSREVVSDEAYGETLRQHGTPEAYVGLLVSLYTAARAGEFDVVDPTLERLIGRKPTTMRQVLENFVSKPEAALFQAR
jgi:NAD(P)H dehydrogenase (quinone)